MKKGIASIIIACIGLYLVYHFNAKWYTMALDIFIAKENKMHLYNELISFYRLTKIAGISIGLLSLYFGVISFLKQNKIGSIGILLAILLIICSFIPFWQLLLEDSTLDINLR